MKKILLISFAILVLPSLCFGETTFRGAISISGLKSLSLSIFADKDVTFVQTDGIFYPYVFDIAATDTESSPTYIRPDDYSTAGVHVLQSISNLNTSSYGDLLIAETATTSMPASGFGVLRSRTDGTLVYENDSGVESDITANTQLTDEQVDDIAGALVENATGTHTRISIAYQDTTGDMDFVVDDMVDVPLVAGDYTAASIDGDDINSNIAGTSLTLTAGSPDTFDVDDDFVKNSESDVMTGTLTADGITLGQDENITLGGETLDHDGTDFVFSDSLSVAGGIESVLSSGEVGYHRFPEDPDNGTSYTGWQAPSSLAGNVMLTMPSADTEGFLKSDGAGVTSFEDIGFKTVSVLLNSTTALTASDKAYFRLPDEMAGWELVSVSAAMVAGTGIVTLDLHNVTQSDTTLLSTKLTIDANETDSDTAVEAVIDTAQDDYTQADRYRVDVDGAGTGTTWCEALFTFRQP